MKKLAQFFKLPSPIDLGMSDHNALPMRDFQDDNDHAPTWEDYRELMEKDYPIRYFLLDSLPFWIRCRWKWYVRNSWYWLKCHILPSHKYHWLDLRQPKNNNQLAYRYGWLETDHQMEYALFNILNNFVEHQMENWYCPTQEEADQEPQYTMQRQAWLEARAIHQWWNVARKNQEDIEDHLLTRWSEAKTNRSPMVNVFWEELKNYQQFNENELEEMMIRLIKARKYLWT